MVKWLELSVRTTPEYVEPFAELFRRYGEGGVVVEQQGDWDPDNDPAEPGPPATVVVRTYLPLDRTAPSRRGMIDVGVRLISLLQPVAGLQERVFDDDELEASWKSHFTLLRVGKRLVIKPTWQDYSALPGDSVVELDPGMAFGTGHHPTTRMCLEELERRLLPGMRVLDLGTGSGILSIAAAKLGAGSILALDVDPVAIRTARANTRSNDVSRSVRVLQGTLPHSQAAPGSFGLVLANITAKAIVSAAGPIADVLAPTGGLVASGIIRDRQAEVEQALQGPLVVLDRRYDGEWVTLVAQRGNEA
ncbi:MAG: 50S ribosomal protein L11 methyltransferase [Chloroflexi bacterium]|nr:50S ribosomal protein L11 methyltransferase [Chloroflexota bacterium]